jgi:hypothetical protein
MAGELGFEPRLTESESAVLPLDDSPGEQEQFRIGKWRTRFHTSRFISAHAGRLIESLFLATCSLQVLVTRLAFRVLCSAACFSQTDFLAFDFTRIAGNKSGLTQDTA